MDEICYECKKSDSDYVITMKTCLTCHYSVCNYCDEKHERLFTGHIVHFTAHICFPESFCKEHKRELVGFYCRSCDSMICRSCARQNHSDHCVKSISDIGSEIRDEIKMMKINIDEELAAVDKDWASCSSELSNTTKQLSMAKQEAENFLYKVFSMMMTDIKQIDLRYGLHDDIDHFLNEMHTLVVRKRINTLIKSCVSSFARVDDDCALVFKYLRFKREISSMKKLDSRSSTLRPVNIQLCKPSEDDAKLLISKIEFQLKSTSLKDDPKNTVQKTNAEFLEEKEDALKQKTLMLLEKEQEIRLLKDFQDWMLEYVKTFLLTKNKRPTLKTSVDTNILSSCGKVIEQFSKNMEHIQGVLDSNAESIQQLSREKEADCAKQRNAKEAVPDPVQQQFSEADTKEILKLKAELSSIQESLQAVIQENEKLITKLEEAEKDQVNLLESLQVVIQENDKLITKLEKAKQDKENLLERLEKSKQNLTQTKNQLQSAEGELDTTKRQQQSWYEEKVALLTRENEKEKWMLKQKLEEVGKEHNLSTKTVEDLKADNNKLRTELEKSKQNLTQTKNQLQSAEGELDTTKRQQQSWYEEKVALLTRENEKEKWMLKQKLEEVGKEHNLSIKTVEDLKADNNKLRTECSDIQSKYKDATKDLEKKNAEIEDLKNRSSEVAGAILTIGSSSIADLGDKYRPTRIAEMYSNIYDNEWTKAVDVLTKKWEDEIVVYHLFIILQACYESCFELAAREMDELVKLMFRHVSADKIDDYSKCHPTELKQLHDTRKRLAVDAAEFVAKDILRTEAFNHVFRRYNGVQGDLVNEIIKQPYFAKCTSVCWLMVVQDPPMVLDRIIPKDTMVDKELYRSYTKSGSRILFGVWPALFLHQDGPLLLKGVAQLY